MAEERLYFAYGSNINLDQMAYRCPAAQAPRPVSARRWAGRSAGSPPGCRCSSSWTAQTVLARLYFAYGSNINLDQMAYRCPAAQVVGPVVLEDYKLLFRGNARGNGVATIAALPFHTGLRQVALQIGGPDEVAPKLVDVALCIRVFARVKGLLAELLHDFGGAWQCQGKWGCHYCAPQRAESIWPAVEDHAGM